MTSLLDKIWNNHLVTRKDGQPDLLYIDRHLLHEVTSPQAFTGLTEAGRRLRRPDLTFATVDHVVPTTDRNRPLKDQVAETQLATLEENHQKFGVKTFFGFNHPNQGVIHVTMPEMGIVLPGQTVVCGDSHTSTHGALGALAFGIGTSEVEHVMATQCLPQRKPKQMAVEISGCLGQDASPKDLALYLINLIGAAGGNGFAIEYRGETVTALSIEGRQTLCNMAIECGAKMGLIAPDEKTAAFLKGKPYAPAGADFEQAVRHWQTLFTDPDFVFDLTIKVDAAKVRPRATWGINPAQSADLADGRVPNPNDLSDHGQRQAAEKALAYQGLAPGGRLKDLKVDYVFIGSCTNGRIEDLRAAAQILKNRRVAQGVTALVVPGSNLAKQAAEAEGLDKIFIEAGAQWRLPGCSMCLGMNDDLVPPGKRCASTSNRNFEDRQGQGARTHLVGPAVAAASAVLGHLAEPADLLTRQL